MVFQDYGKIIITGLCNSPNHLKEHFNRAVIELKERHYSQSEIEDNLRQVNDLFKDRVKALYARENRKYLDYAEKDKDLSKEVQYNYPRPEIESISLSYFEYPSGGKDSFPNKRKYLLKDFEDVEVALDFVFSTQQAETETEQGTSPFTNNFDNIKPTEIYRHFKAGLVEKGYLTEQELNDYLKAAFELKTIPETLFRLKHTPTKQKIYTVFYVYYKDISQKKHERQKEYAALLGDYFEGYQTRIIQTNWARDYKTKR